MNLGDARRNERAKTLLTRLAEKPTASIPHACHGWSETMGAYRFMENPAFGWRDILQPHWQRTQKRMRQDHLGGLATGHDCSTDTTRSSPPSRLSRDVYNEVSTSRLNMVLC
ncbi:transposase [Ralstonia solanacearum]|uniref:IS4/Tn5 family transposase DNA-binding protein n=1 Tax=Ralstonia solanacearum TaxID=305 RepID=UPI00399D5EB4